MDIDLLSWIFKESLIKKCFVLSMRATGKNGKQAACDFINVVCDVHRDDLSSYEDQCE